MNNSMKQYIDKAALVADIEKLISKGNFKSQQAQENNDPIEYIGWSGYVATCRQILSIIDTLEGEEVDLEKHLKEDIENVLFDLDGVAVKGATHYLTVEDVKDIAKHFYELGLKAQGGE